MSSSAESPEISRRTFMKGLGMGAAATAIGELLFSSDQTTLPPTGSVVSYDDGPRDGDIQEVSMSQPAQPEPDADLSPADRKTLAEARKLNAEAADIEAGTEHADAAAEKTRAEAAKVAAEAEKVKADADKTKADAAQVRRSTELEGTFGDRLADAAPWVAAGGTLAGVVITQAHLHRKNSRDAYAAAEKERLDRQEKERETRDAEFVKLKQRLSSSQEADPAKNTSKGADLELLSFTTPERHRYHRDVFELAVGLLRSRPHTAQNLAPDAPSAFDQNILSALLRVVGPLRELERDRRTAMPYMAHVSRVPYAVMMRNEFTDSVPVLDASGVNLDGMNLVGGEDLSQLDLSGASMRHTKLTEANFSGCDLRGADLSNAEAPGVTFYRCDVRDMNVKDANFQGSLWKEVGFAGFHINEARYLRDARIDGTAGLSPSVLAELQSREDGSVSVQPNRDYFTLAGTARGDD